MRFRRLRVLLIVPLLALTACQQDNWHDFSGNNRSSAELRMDSASCQLDSQSGGQADTSNCNTKGCAIALTSANILSQTGSFNTCMESRGWERVEATAVTQSFNSFLWRAALDTTAFMPEVSTDPSNGAIITGWYEPPKAKGERFKIKAMILGKALSADNIKIVLFKQKLDDTGIWRDAEVAPHVASDLQQTILTRARRIHTAQSSK